MHRVTLVCLAVVLVSCAAAAQSSNPVSDAARQLLQRQSRNLIGAADGMPADKYGFKPTPAQEPFGHLMAHAAEANNLFCSKLTSLPPAKQELKDDSPKEQVVAALRASFDYCGKALAELQDSSMGNEAEVLGRKATRAVALVFLTNNWADHYGQASVYLRLNGVLPPSAQK